ncbi:MAG: dihydroorotase [Marinilabiliaceae bacterium]|nr:dihydroorotase [Marinilabiliaceae bacterium]
MQQKLIKNATIINEGKTFIGSILISGDTITEIYKAEDTLPQNIETIDATGQLLIPGVIDDQVHFREPGLEYKADIYSETKSAIAGGVTSYMEMPNTKPQTTTQESLDAKYAIAAQKSLANYSFYIGATNDNIEELLKTNPKTVCGVKVFMGSSTGNMLVDNEYTLKQIFSKVSLPITTHCEDEDTIKKNTVKYKALYGDNPSFNIHPQIRSDEACFLSTKKAVELAKETGAKLHVLHLSSAKEMALFDDDKPLEKKKITGEVCVHHLWFTNNDYDKYGSRIKWNPAVKSEADRNALRQALISGKLDVVATDHAPHTIEEKENSYFNAPSGGPLVQHSLVSMLEMVNQGVFDIELVVYKMCHAPAILFNVELRGFIRKGYKADIVLIDKKKWIVNKNNIFYKCQWSPFEGVEFNYSVSKTFVNGHLAYNNGTFDDTKKGERLTFNR